MKNHPKQKKGFTLIELMVTLAILAIVISLAVPSFTIFIQNSRLDTTAQTLSTILKQARSEAVGRQAVVTADWSTGSIYVDIDGDGSALEAGDPIIKQNINLEDDGVTPDSNTNNAQVSFNADGTLNEGGNAVSIGVCDARGAAEGWTININTVGRVALTQAGVNCTP